MVNIKDARNLKIAWHVFIQWLAVKGQLANYLDSILKHHDIGDGDEVALAMGFTPFLPNESLFMEKPSIMSDQYRYAFLSRTYTCPYYHHHKHIPFVELEREWRGIALNLAARLEYD